MDSVLLCYPPLNRVGTYSTAIKPSIFMSQVLLAFGWQVMFETGIGRSQLLTEQIMKRASVIPASPFLLAMAAAAASMLYGVGAVAADLEGQFKHPQHKFSVSYPIDWARVSYHDGPDLLLVSNKGEGPEECNVVVDDASGDNQLNNVNSQAMRSALNAALVNPELVSWRKEEFDGKTSIRYEFTAGRQEARQGTLGMQVVSGGKLYTVSCNAPLRVYSDQRSLFKEIVETLDF